MDTLLLRRAALLQAKLKVLEEQKDCFTDHAEILAFHRVKKQFDTLIAAHKDQLPPDPLEAIKEDFDKDKHLLDQLQRIASEAELRCATFNQQHHNYFTPDFLQGTIQWLSARRESLQGALATINSRISHEYWRDDHSELQPDAKALAQFLSNDDLLRPGLKDWLAMSQSKGPKYEKFLKTLDSIDAILRRNVIYVLRAGQQRGPFLLEDLDGLLAKRTIVGSDLAWHYSVTDWQPLSALVLYLESRKILPAPSAVVRFKRWAKHCFVNFTTAIKKVTGSTLP